MSASFVEALLKSLFSVFCLLFCLTGICPAGNVTLSGVVVTGVSPEAGNQLGLGRPLNGVAVSIEGTEYHAVSNASGYFFFEEVPAGQYTLKGEKSGYPSVAMRVQVAGGPLPSRCQLLMNARDAAVVSDVAVGSGAVYVAYSEKANKLKQDGSSIQYALAAGADPTQLWNREEILPGSALAKGGKNFNPVSSDPNCLMVYAPEAPQHAGFTRLDYQPFWLCFNANGRELYVAGAPSVLQVLDTSRNNRAIATIPMRGTISHLGMSKDRRYLLACLMGAQPGVMLIDTTTHKPVCLLATPSAPWSAEMLGNHIYACCGDSLSGKLLDLDVTTGLVGRSLPLGNLPTSIALTPDGKMALVCAAGDATLSMVDLASWTEVRRLRVGVSPQRLAISPDGKRALVCNRGDNTVSLVDVTAGAVTGLTKVGRGPVSAVYSANGHQVFVTCSDSRVVMTLDGHSGNILYTSVPLPHSSPYGITLRP